MRVLVFAAHPDDAEFGAGGTLLKLAERCDLTICALTDGSAGTHGCASVRREEQKAAATFLGADLIQLDMRDCLVENTRANAFKLAQVIRDVKADIVLVPHWDQRGGIHDGLAHPDHRHLGLLVRDAARFARFGIDELTGERHVVQQVWYYMVPRLVKPAIAIPIDDVLPRLRELWACHATQLALRDGHIVEHLLHSRGVAAEQLRGVQYAELLDSDAPVRLDILSAIFGNA
jgi:LmbE family N-acetylglucosaminyl deacetylase